MTKFVKKFRTYMTIVGAVMSVIMAIVIIVMFVRHNNRRDELRENARVRREQIMEKASSAFGEDFAFFDTEFPDHSSEETEEN